MKMKYKVTYIDCTGKKVTRLCYRVSHYKNYVKLDYMEEYNGMLIRMYEDVEYKNIIKEEMEK